MIYFHHFLFSIVRRYETRFDSLIAILPYCSKVKFYDNENRFDNVAEYRNEEIIFKSDYKPDWLVELRQRLDQQELVEQ